MDRRGFPDRVRRYLIPAAVALAALWSHPVPVDAPLYSKTTGLPIFGNPANCGCCGGGGGPEFDSACGNCAADTTPLQVEVVLSGIRATPADNAPFLHRVCAEGAPEETSLATGRLQGGHLVGNVRKNRS